MTGTKICNKCGECKPATAEFWHSDKTRKDGLQKYCKPCQRQSTKQSYEANKHKVLVRVKAYDEKNKIQRLTRVSRNKAKRRANDCVFQFAESVSNLVRRAFSRSGLSKAAKTEEVLCIDLVAFRKHIERQFLDGMSWENRDQWHIDHIIPLATAKTEEDVIRLNHYTNLRPLWAKDNLRKGANQEFLL